MYKTIMHHRNIDSRKKRQDLVNNPALCYGLFLWRKKCASIIRTVKKKIFYWKHIFLTINLFTVQLWGSAKKKYSECTYKERIF